MSNEKIVSIRGVHNLLKSESYRLYYELKQDILKDYPPVKKRSREENLEIIKRISDLMWEVGGPFQEFIWEQMSEQHKLEQDRLADGKLPNGRKPYIRKNEDINE